MSETVPLRADRRINLLIAFVGLAILAVTVAASLPSATGFGDRMTRNTIRLSFA